MAESSPASMDWIGLVILGVFQFGLSYAIFAVAIRHVTAKEGILIPVLEPLSSSIRSGRFLAERW